MKYQAYIFIIMCLFLQCKSSIDCNSSPISKGKNRLLISFEVNPKPIQILTKYSYSNPSQLIDKILNLQTNQIEDTLKVEFLVYEGNYACFDTDIDINEDTIFLKMWKEIPIRELVLFKYSYEIMNNDKTNYQVKIESIN